MGRCEQGLEIYVDNNKQADECLYIRITRPS